MIVDIAVPSRFSKSLHYEIDDNDAHDLGLGSVVEIPLQSRTVFGFVLGFPASTDVPKNKIKSVQKVLCRQALLDPAMLQLLNWMADYYCQPLGEVISVALPKASWTAPKKPKKVEEATADSPVNVFNQAQAMDLTPAQKVAVSKILDLSDLRPLLLHGVTGSGKTEVYMAAIDRVIALGKGAIVLCPEISLTPQLLGRFASRFPGITAVLHSDQRQSERFHEWQRVFRGEARIVIGPRSAVFAPIKNLGLIVVDEEHETSFKQEDSVRYHARDVAIVRAKNVGAKVVLGSATPSVETYFNFQSGRFDRVLLSERIHSREMPKPTFVDIRKADALWNPQYPWLSKVLHQKISSSLEKGQQVLLYLNRLGYAHFIYCKDCGHTWKCKHCEVSLTYYKNPPRLKCHYCGYSTLPPNTCEKCAGVEVGFMGFGTQQIEAELRKIFPEYTIDRMDRSAIQKRGQLEALLARVSRKEIDILIGTQMVTKGHDFPNISLVGILVADASLNLPDFRAYERTFQVITQVSGRAGRAEIAGEVVLQTFCPENEILQMAALQQGEEFYLKELEQRRRFGFPPYQRLAIMRMQHKNAAKVKEFAFQLTDVLTRNSEGATILGPAEAPLSKVKDEYRWHCVVKSPSSKVINTLLKMSHKFAEHQRTSVKLSVDVDPIQMW